MQRTEVDYTFASKHPSNLTKDAVEKFAGQVSQALEFKPGADVKQTVECLGGRIAYVDPVDIPADGGTIFIHGPGDFDVLLSLSTSPRRDRFTLAHELGHYFLHSNQGDIPLIANRHGSDRAEWEANWFAAAMLMPKQLVRRLVDSKHTNAEIAYQLRTSEDAVKIRRKALSI